jgi:flagella basal body P-ring formation protein FlgA
MHKFSVRRKRTKFVKIALLTFSMGLTVAATITASAFADPLTIDREIHIKPQIQVWSKTVCLSDLADDTWLQNHCLSDKATCCRWSIGDGRVTTLTLEEIQREVAHGKWGGFTLKVEGPSEINVTQVGREITTAELREKIAAAVANRLAEDATKVTVSGLKTQMPIAISFSEENDWDVMAPETVTEHASLKIVSTQDASRILGWVQASLRVESDVYVAKKLIRPMDQINLENFELRKVNLLPLQTQGVTAFHGQQFPAGTRARMTVMPGAALTTASVERVPLVKLGDNVTLILRSDNLKISTKGVAQSSAAIGDMITVQLSRYNRTFRGRLIDGKLVEVWL